MVLVLPFGESERIQRLPVFWAASSWGKREIISLKKLFWGIERLDSKKYAMAIEVFQEKSIEFLVISKILGMSWNLTRGRLYPLSSGKNDIFLCKGSKCRDD